MGYKPLVVLMNDFDGNLLDTMEAHGRLAADCIHEYFGMDKEKAETAYHSTTGVSFDEQLRILFPKAAEEQRFECARKYHERKLKEVYEAAELFPELKEILLRLRNYRFPMLVNTGT